MDWLKLVHGAAEPAPPAFRPGDEVRVWYRILEQGKERLGQFEGTVIRVRGAGPSRTFTVRRVTHGEGVERVFPVDSKTVARVELLRAGKVRRSRLYFLRSVVGKRRIAAADQPDAVNAEPPAEKAEGLAATTRPSAPHP
ncbi:MAG: 50S ribosomal protein L19 [Candidatus Omnitrophica bacterium]|nr:50S ribosomal protein L19 [Candidatus Omnitrophota bacterium]